MNSTNKIKLADFGLSDNLKGEELSFRTGGTRYLAPKELLENGNEIGYSNKLDIFYMGGLLFELAVGQSTAKENRNVCNLTNLSEQLKNLIDKMINDEDPSKRPSTDEILVMDLIKPYYEKYAGTIVSFKNSVYKIKKNYI